MTDTSETTTHRVALSSGTFAYAEAGHGPTILAIHGIPGDRRDFAPMADILTQGHRLISIDLPGFGASSPPRGLPSCRAAAATIGEFIEKLGVCPVVLGYSIGGAVAIQLAAQRPRSVLGLALIASIGISPHRLVRTSNVATISRVLRIPGAPFALERAIRKAYAQSKFRDDITDAQKVLSIHYLGRISFAAQRQAATSLTMPTWMAWAEDDWLIQADISEELARALPTGPRVRLERGAHAIHKRAAPELARSLANWLDTLE